MSDLWKKRLLWGLTIGWMGVIFLFSMQNGAESQKTSDTLTIWLVRQASDFDRLSEEMQAASLQAASYTVRKAAHMLEYAVLGALLSLLLRCYCKKLWLHGLLAWPIAVIYAGTDELHQMFSAGRAAKLLDVAIDSAGAVCGILAVFLCLLFATQMGADTKNQ